jgi:hypothetical protein
MLKAAGMLSSAEELSQADAKAVRSYVIFRAHQTLAEEQTAAITSGK